MQQLLIAKKTNKVLRILLIAKNDLMQYDSHKIKTKNIDPTINISKFIDSLSISSSQLNIQNMNVNHDSDIKNNDFRSLTETIQ